MKLTKRELMLQTIKKAKSEGIRFRTYHAIKQEKEIGRITVAKKETPEGTIQLGVLYCSPLDILAEKYNKLYGQFHAYGRLMKKSKRINVAEHSDIKNAVVALAEMKAIRWFSRDIQLV